MHVNTEWTACSREEDVAQKCSANESISKVE
jgi:hypothetical protein